jgi:pyroglutamyl-peptidase
VTTITEARIILLTGFEPFGGSRSNPSQQVAADLDGLILPGLNQQGARVVSALLPVDAARAPAALDALLKQHQPDAVLLTGLASGRAQLSLERVALNVMDFRLPDNAGQIHSEQPISQGGPDALLSTLPLRSILAAWRAAGLPGYVSDTAGLYLCNLVMYHVRLRLSRSRVGPAVPAGFLHLPACEQLALESASPLPYLPQLELTRGVRLALETLAIHLELREQSEDRQPS